jgi:diguanylate cyclase (GGDEF)-like protein/PAS domain S-box-containing protein
MVYRKNPPQQHDLRELAVARRTGRTEVAVSNLDLSQAQHLLEELEIHQIELELQNEHLSTAREQLEQALTQSTELYDFSPVGCVLLDTEGIITKLNLMGAQLLASERARLLNQRFGLHVTDAQRPQFNAMLARARAEHGAQTGDLMLQAEGHTPAHVQAKVVWIGPSSGWQIALVDMSEQRRMEAQLRASEERMTLALAAVGDGVWDWQLSKGEMQFSTGFEEVCGFSSDELGHQMSDFTARIHPDDKPQAIQKLQDCITGTSNRLQSEYRMQCKHGGWKWVFFRGAVIVRGTDGQTLRMVGTLVDISQKKQAESTLAVAAKFQQAVFDAISAHIAVLDHAGTIVQTNAAWQHYASGLNCGETVGKGYLAVLGTILALAPATTAALVAGMSAVVAGELPFFHGNEPIQSAGKNKWFTIKITPLRDTAHRLVVTHEDVSELKRAELASWTLANVDALTGALSRQNFLRLAEHELTRSVRYSLPLVVLMLDLDHFKHVNDTYGHQGGDAVLQAFVHTVKGVLRESDVIGRIGGEEFVVLLPNTTYEGGLSLATRILAEVRVNTVEFCGKQITYTVSMGARCLSRQTSFASLLGECDAALYRAKKGGRDRLEMGESQPLAHPA